MLFSCQTVVKLSLNRTRAIITLGLYIFLLHFWSPFLCFQSFFQKILALYMVSIQEWFLIKNRLRWRAYGIILAGRNFQSATFFTRHLKKTLSDGPFFLAPSLPFWSGDIYVWPLEVIEPNSFQISKYLIWTPPYIHFLRWVGSQKIQKMDKKLIDALLLNQIWKKLINSKA